jgi:hypothetical protein
VINGRHNKLYQADFIIHQAAGQWFSLCTSVSSTNKSDRHDIAELSGVNHKNTLFQ